MNNYNGTILRIGFIFIFLLTVWVLLGGIISLLITYLFNINFNLHILSYAITSILVIRIFYPKFIFKN